MLAASRFPAFNFLDRMLWYLVLIQCFVLQLGEIVSNTVGPPVTHQAPFSH